jgi:hypothetical protein
MNYNYLNSAFVGPYYPMLVELGYPQLDIKKWDDGEWAILEMLNAPLCPSLTRFTYVLKKIRHMEITESNVKKMVHSIDPCRSEFWIREAEKSLGVELEHESSEAHKEDTMKGVYEAVTRNPALMDRIARFGASEMNPEKIALRIAEENPAAARRLGITVYNENKVTGETHICQ